MSRRYSLLYTVQMILCTIIVHASLVESYSNSTLCKDLIFQDELPRSCLDILCLGSMQNGIYYIHPTRRPEYFLQVFCDQETDGGGWLVFQRRMDGSVNFKRNWKNYQLGFGELNGEFWLGNDNLAVLTKPQSEIAGTELRVDLEDFDNVAKYAQYSSFMVGDKSNNYVLTVGGYSGDANDSMTWHDGNKFSTIDKDNDVSSSSSCAQRFMGGWWYKDCHKSNLNGLYLSGSQATYAEGVNWAFWRGYYYSLKTTEMKIRPKVETGGLL